MASATVQKYKHNFGSFIRSEKGQRFFNFAYSIGAAVVIWGALFKILHLPGGNLLLSLGMGTEVLMFVLTAFDRPPREYHWEDVFPELRGTPEGAEEAPADVAQALSNRRLNTAAAPLQGVAVTPLSVPEGFDGSMAAINDNLIRLQKAVSSLTELSENLLESFRGMADNTSSVAGYASQMQALERNIAGLNAIYELQLRSVSSQVESIDRVNRGIKDIRDMYEKSASMSIRYCEETERMAHYMQQLNSIYERMVQAMTVNMYHPGMTPPSADGMPASSRTGNKD